MKHFIIDWYANEKYIDPIPRQTQVSTIDMQNAMYVFKAAMGSLKNKTINYIQEVTPAGAAIGEKIFPQKEEKQTTEATLTKEVV